MKKNWLRALPGQLGQLAAQAGSGLQVYGEKMCILSIVLDGLVSRGAVCGHSLETGLCMTQPFWEHSCRAKTPSASEWQQVILFPSLVPHGAEAHLHPCSSPLCVAVGDPGWPCGHFGAVILQGSGTCPWGRGVRQHLLLSFLSLVHSDRLTQLVQMSHTSQDTWVKSYWVSQAAWAA